MSAMLGDIDALPGAERHAAVGDRNMQRDAVEHGFDMRRHVVRPFGVVHPAGIGRGEAIERGHKIDLHIRIGIFLNNQRRRRVADEQEKRAASRVMSTKPSPGVATFKLAVATVSTRAC